MENTTKVSVMMKWYSQQDKFRILYDSHPGRGIFVVRDTVNNIQHLEEFSSHMDALTWCYSLHHGLMNVHEDHWDSTVEIRDYLLEQERELVIKLGLPRLNKRQQDVLGMMLCIVQDAIKSENFLYGLSTIH